MLKAIYKTIRVIPEKALHARRHRSARARLASSARPRQILVVCHGNICRSPYLQAVLQRLLPDVAVHSAGLFGSDRPVPPSSLSLGAERGLDLSTFRSRPVTTTLTNAADLIVVMDRSQAKFLQYVFGVPARKILIAGDLDTASIETRGIVDPWEKDPAVYRRVFDRLDRCAAVLARSLRRPEHIEVEVPIQRVAATSSFN